MNELEFKKLFDMHFDTIRSYVYYRLGNAEVATDIAQDVFMRLWEKQLTPEPKRALGLLYKIAGDMAISKYRRGIVEMNYTNSLTFEFDNVSPQDELQYNELKQAYLEALTNLPEKQRVVFLMSRAEELTYQEIAERLGLSVKAIEKRMKNALASLKKALNK